MWHSSVLQAFLLLSCSAAWPGAIFASVRGVYPQTLVRLTAGHLARLRQGTKPIAIRGNPIIPVETIHCWRSKCHEKTS
jgi:hypothetical protein